MFIPVGDTPNPRNFRPWVNWSLIAVNIAIFLLISLPLSSQRPDPENPLLWEYIEVLSRSHSTLTSLRAILSQVSMYDLFVFANGYKPGRPEILDLLFSLFLHANFWHLAGNMLFLWIYGDNVEHHLGRLGYLVTYITTGVIATLFFSLFAGQSLTPLIGASGAISGVLGLYFLLFPRNHVKVFVALFPIFFNVILLPARLVLGIYLVLDNLFPFLTGAQGGVAYGAHIGGFVAGLGIAWAGEHFAWHWPWADKFGRLGKASARRPKTASKPDAPASWLAEVREALATQNPDQALQAVAHMDRSELTALRPDECVSLAGWLEDAGHSVAATRILRQCLSHAAPSENLAEVYLQLGLMRLRQGQPTAAYQHLLNVFDYTPSPQTAARARQAMEQIDIFRRKR